jgi:hypothetical protein
MAITRIIGNDGSIGTGAFAAAGGNGTHDGLIRQWEASFPRVATEVTGFTDTLLRQHRLGMTGIEGTLTGVPQFDAASTNPGVGDRVSAGSSTILQVAAGCSYTATLAFQNMSHSVDKTGESVLTVSFVNGVSDALTIAWDETP